MLPEFLRELRISNLQIGKAVVDLSLQRHAQNVSIGILRREAVPLRGKRSSCCVSRVLP